MGTIGIVDIGLGNIDSVGRAVRYLRHNFVFCRHPSELVEVDKIIFPGVGSYGAASKLLDSTGFREVLRTSVLEQHKPILGICLGMQLLAGFGEEGGGGQGLGLVSGEVRRHRGASKGVTIPHIGWNDVVHNGGILYKGTPSGFCFYFVHSYELILTGKVEFEGISQHGVDFTASIEDGIVFGTQFHPEKSQESGLRVLNNFIEFEKC